MKVYSYRGPVMVFDKCVEHYWTGETAASSEKKARSNLAYQYKKEMGLIPQTKVSIPGKLKIIE